MEPMRIELVDETVVVRIAHILGSFSAAQRALDDAAVRRGRGEEVVFGTSGKTLLVVPKSALVAR